MADREYVPLDTDVYSYLTKGGALAEIYKPHVAGKTICVCFITVGELLYGAKKRGWSAARIEDAKQKLRAVITVPYDYEMCVQYGELKASLEERGITVALHDLWIASCALRHSIPLISNNRKHFSHISQFGLELISEAPVVAEIVSQGDLSSLFELADTMTGGEPSADSSDSQHPSSRSAASASEKKDS